MIYKIIVIIFLVTSLVGIGYLVMDNKQVIEDFGSVNVSHEYRATSTAGMSGVIVKANEFTQLIASSTSGIVLGSVIVASTTPHSMYIYNASSTNAVAGGETANITLLAKFPTSTSQGTYVFDTQLNKGLVIKLESGFGGDYVITYRR